MAVYTALLSFLSVCAVVSTLASAANTTTRTTPDCSCGFYDPSTQDLFTDSTIVYFNETKTIPNATFTVESYEHSYERNWNALYRTGARKSNLHFGNDSLELYVSPSTPDHLVVGASLRTTRQDIQYGSFRSWVRSPPQWPGGSVLSMLLNYNETEAFSLNMMNRNDPSDAWVSTLAGNQFPDRNLGVNYSTLTNSTSSPWEYLELRVDWTKDKINYFVAGNLTRSISKGHGIIIPSTPAPLHLQHWSVGDWYSSQGPPTYQSTANLLWTRFFFNSSSTTADERRTFDARCSPSAACRMDDLSLRSTSSYPIHAVRKWKLTHPQWRRRWPPILIASVGMALSTLVLLHAIVRRSPWEKFRAIKQEKPQKRPDPVIAEAQVEVSDSTSQWRSAAWVPEITNFATAGDPPAFTRLPWMTPSDMTSGNITPQTLTRPSSVVSMDQRLYKMSAASENGSVHTGDMEATDQGTGRTTSGHTSRDASTLVISPAPTAHLSSASSTTLVAPPMTNFTYGRGSLRTSATHRAYSDAQGEDNMAITPVPLPPDAIESVHHSTQVPGASHRRSGSTLTFGFKLETVPEKIGDVTPGENTHTKSDTTQHSLFPTWRSAATSPHIPPLSRGAALQSETRENDLAGLLTVSSLIITAIHFCRTFVGATITPGEVVHYQSEVWARKIVSAYFLNLVWLGPFLMTSARYLIGGFLRTGDLGRLAEKAITRMPRLMIPVAAAAALQYFLMESGATKWLEYLASVTWTSWPYAVGYNNFGDFVSEILELAYLIPNGFPHITYNYCSGVLWTIPVQLQGSWQTIISVLMIYEIKTPWKRFGFYAFCILNHWYALSWGTYFYFGILLTDLDLTFKWRKWLIAHPLALYPAATLALVLAVAGLSMDMITEWTNVNYATYEYGWHPDIPTAKPIARTGAFSYPQYFIPKLNGLIFSVGIQALVEISPLVQRMLSFRVLQWIFPHIFTLYLMHGFVFWSLGALVCTHLSALGLPYWLNIFVTGMTCYAALFVFIPMFTPIVEVLGRNVTASIWDVAHVKPALFRKTLYPYPADLLQKYDEVGAEAEEKRQQITDVEGTGNDAIGKSDVNAKDVDESEKVQDDVSREDEEGSPGESSRQSNVVD